MSGQELRVDHCSIRLDGLRMLGYGSTSYTESRSMSFSAFNPTSLLQELL